MLTHFKDEQCEGQVVLKSSVSGRSRSLGKVTLVQVSPGQLTMASHKRMLTGT